MNVATPIDLRSDTVTRPSQEMRSAIAAAPVGDDQCGDDPTVNALQERVAALLGKEAALWLPADRLAKSRSITFDLATVQTNILVLGLAADAPDAMALVAKARERGVLINVFGPRTVRAVTHLDVSRDQCTRAADVLVELAGVSTA